MSKNPAPKIPTKPPVITKAVTVRQTSRLSFEAFELTIEDGIVVDETRLTRAPDLCQVAIGHTSRRLWQIGREQRAEDFRDA